ncbi:urease accessory protein UreD [Neptuniibacter sp. CAU 1671]|uniref:urease accessory protein UreD n=1 Tax=Neptuniibacter sp. CAU 1671 TaxID=3032593 RepID=UPI0023DBD3BC|nr:urease accessory protein UreD [Neptuniibacter sp. CAU 1671]MDF2181046.1 urease accessory protein UreD [Neptuniibacter sp. CAU 1671]
MNSRVMPITEPAPATWLAELALGFRSTPRGVVLHRNRHKGPLYVQKPFYPEGRDLAHVYLLHPPGGIVSGDHLQISIELEPQSRALITTPGAGRVYRARADKSLQQQHIHLQVAAGASLEWLPQETIIYSGAHTHLKTQIELEEGAQCVSWEVTCLGLPASQAPFREGALLQQLECRLGGRPLLRESLHLDQDRMRLLTSPAGLAGQPVTGLMFAGPFREISTELLDGLRQRCSAVADPAMAAVTELHHCLVVRYLGPSAEQARRLFTDCWQQLRPELLERQACQPRIWAT